MGGMRFKANHNLEREVSKAAEKALHDNARVYQKALDSVARRYEGKPVSTIKPVLKREWARLGGRLSDPELTQYATCISQGASIEFKIRKQRITDRAA